MHTLKISFVVGKSSFIFTVVNFPLKGWLKIANGSHLSNLSIKYVPLQLVFMFHLSSCVC